MEELEILIRYPYGAFYDVSLPAGKSSSTAVIIYADTQGVTRDIDSLEGYFLSPVGLSHENLVCRRTQMKDFEEKYGGRFQTFSEAFKT